MRTAFNLGFAANLVLAFVALILSPDKVAIHFGYGGEPDGWAPAYMSALIMASAVFWAVRLIKVFRVPKEGFHS